MLKITGTNSTLPISFNWTERDPKASQIAILKVTPEPTIITNEFIRSPAKKCEAPFTLAVMLAKTIGI